jgi:thiol:disulfide interchange protein
VSIPSHLLLMSPWVKVCLLAAGLWIGLQAIDRSVTGQAGSGRKGDAPAGFVTNYNSALSRSRRDRKPMVLVFSASWCPPCKQMKREVYPSAEVTAIRDDFVWA